MKSVRYRRWLVAICAMTVMFSGIVVSSARADSSDWFTIRNANTKLCLSSYPDKIGQPATQQVCNGSANQQWSDELAGPGVVLANKGMLLGSASAWDYGCLKNQGDVVANGNPLVMYPCNPSSPYKNTNGLQWLINIANNTTDAVDFKSVDNERFCATSRGNSSVGSGVFLWVCDGSINEQWVLPIPW